MKRKNKFSVLSIPFGFMVVFGCLDMVGLTVVCAAIFVAGVLVVCTGEVTTALRSDVSEKGPEEN